MDSLPEPRHTPAVLIDIRRLIEETRTAVVAAVNTGLTLLYWRIGKRINEEILQGERAAYGAADYLVAGQAIGKRVRARFLGEVTSPYGAFR